MNLLWSFIDVAGPLTSGWSFENKKKKRKEYLIRLSHPALFDHDRSSIKIECLGRDWLIGTGFGKEPINGKKFDLYHASRSRLAHLQKL